MAYEELIDLEIGRTGLWESGGYIHEEKLKQLNSPQRRNATFKEMSDNDPIVGSVLFVTDMLMRQVDWHVEPYRDPDAVAKATEDANKAALAAMEARAQAEIDAKKPAPPAAKPASTTTKAAPAASGVSPMLTPSIMVDPVTPEDLAVARFVESCFNDLNRPFKDVISEALSFLIYGWSWMELVFKKREGDQGADTLMVGTGLDAFSVSLPPGKPSSKFTDGKIGWHKMAGRSQDTQLKWLFDEYGELLAMTQMAPPTYKEVVIPLAKSLHFRTTSRRNDPEGRSILRNSYRPWYFKKVIEEIQAVGIERDLAGLPVMYVPEELMRSDLSPEQQAIRNNLEQIVRNVRRGDQEGILAPRRIADGGIHENVYELTLLSTAGARQFDIKAILEYYDQRIAVTSVADFVLLGHKAVGSFALADNKTNIFAMAIEAWLGVIGDQFNERAIPQLLRINNMDATRAPHLVHTDIETVDIEKLSKYVTALSGAGMPLFPNAALQAHLLAQAGLPGGSVTEI